MNVCINMGHVVSCVQVMHMFIAAASVLCQHDSFFSCCTSGPSWWASRFFWIFWLRSCKTNKQCILESISSCRGKNSQLFLDGRVVVNSLPKKKVVLNW